MTDVYVSMLIQRVQSHAAWSGPAPFLHSKEMEKCGDEF